MQMVLPDYATRVDALSLSCCFLGLKGIGDTPRQATGFFWRSSGDIYLLTNWHVVTGVNMLDGKSRDGWVPERLEVQYFTKPVASAAKQPIANPLEFLSPKFEIPLYAEFHEPYWIQHPYAFEWGVDLVALKIDRSKFSHPENIACVNDRQYPKLYHFVGSDVFVLGHPLPQKGNNYGVPFPVWKRGSIASELIIPWNMRPAFLIDSRTSHGMSGGPVFARAFGPAAYGDGTIHANNILDSEFMGIYSGRVYDDENNASLGLVWHRNLIDQMLSSPAKGSRIWEASSFLARYAIKT
jgi:hypothetical protein